MASNSQLVYIFAVEQRQTIWNFCETNETEHGQTDALLRQMQWDGEDCAVRRAKK